MNNDYIVIKVQKQFNNKTINNLLMFYHISKSRIYKMNMNKSFYVNDDIVTDSFVLKENQVLKIKYLNDEELITPYKGSIDIIYEDDDVIVVNKPSNLLVHSDGITNNSLTNIVNYHMQNRGFLHNVLPVHRIDVQTSGLVMFAKHFIALSYLSYQFEINAINKEYECLVDGIILKSGFINSPITKDRHSNKYVISSSGKKSYTEYKVINHIGGRTHLQVNIKSGRTHQIRVHLNSIKHPITGDKLYNPNTTESELKLVSTKISFPSPSNFTIITVSLKKVF